MQIPFIDLYAQYKSIKKEIDDSIESLHAGGSYIKNESLSNFESEFAGYIGSKYCIGVANGSDAIFIALKALKIVKEDHIITTSLSWSSTATSISRIGATVDFVDTDENGLIDVNQIEEKINSKTKAIVIVHLYGNSCEMLQIQAICNKYNIHLIEDCAQAIGSKFKGQMLGTFGNISTFSFYPTKILGAYGDAGSCVTNDEDLKNRISLIANYGIEGNDVIDIGINSRLDAIQAAVLKIKLKHLPSWIEKRQEICNLIVNKTNNSKITFLNYTPNSNIQYLVLRTKNREDLQKHLKNKGIETQIHYPFVLPKLQVYNLNEKFKNAELLSKEVLSIPCFPEMQKEQIDYLISTLNTFEKF